MVKKTVGYVKLEWTCPRCGTRNPGPQKFCNGCGAPQPEDVVFEQPAQERLIEDKAELARAKAGPDVHCPYCGARNPAGAKFCGACGGDLAGAQARQSGRVLGAYRAAAAAPITCPSCGTQNPADALACSQCGSALARPSSDEPAAGAKTPARPAAKLPLIGLVIGGVVLCVVAVLALFLLTRTEDLQGQVQGVEWTRSIAVEALGPVQLEDWRDELPADAQAETCSLKFRSTSDEPEPIATEVCGTPYTLDTGGGYGEVVQDCSYQVYDDWCEYTAQEWHTVDTLTASGSNLDPHWPEVSLAGATRAGEESETYRVILETPDGTYQYTPTDLAEFSQFLPGSEWILRVNSLNAVVSVEPAE